MMEATELVCLQGKRCGGTWHIMSGVWVGTIFQGDCFPCPAVHHTLTPTTTSLFDSHLFCTVHAGCYRRATRNMDI